MRQTLYRILVAALLVLAVPVQGFAAVSSGICMAVTGHDAGHGHDHDAAHDHGPESDESHSAGSHCAPCVSCCAAVAIAPIQKLVLPEVRPIAAFAAPKYWIAGIVPGNPERPPLAL